MRSPLPPLRFASLKKHPFLIDLDVRLRRARQIKAMLATIGHSKLASDDDRVGGCP